MKHLKPIVIERGKGVYLYDKEGKEYIDIVSSWWCNLLGHCNEKINQAMKEQLDKLEHVIFANFTHEPAIKLCEQLIEIIPKGLTNLIFPITVLRQLNVRSRWLFSISIRQEIQNAGNLCVLQTVIMERR